MSHDETPREIDWGATAASGNREGEAGTWAWATQQGAAELASTEQLRRWLARGDLPPSTLVWKPGWTEWVPARLVAELAPPNVPTLTPHAIDLAVPAPRATAVAPEEASKRSSGRGWLGTLIIGAVAVLSVGSSWAAFSLAMRGLQPVDASSPQSSPSAQPAAGASALPEPSPPAEPARAEMKHTPDRRPRTREPQPAVLRVGDLPTARSRAANPAPHAPAGRRVSSRH